MAALLGGLPIMSASAQERGDVMLGVTLGGLTKGGVFLKYYVADRVGVEAEAFLLPFPAPVGGQGVGLDLHPFSNEDIIVHAGVSQRIVLARPGPGALVEGRPGMRRYKGSVTYTAFNVGIGAEPPFAGEERSGLAFQVGPSLIFLTRSWDYVGPEGGGGPRVREPSTVLRLRLVPHAELGVGSVVN